jgi:hypothetical protein
VGVEVGTGVEGEGDEAEREDEVEEGVPLNSGSSAI